VDERRIYQLDGIDPGLRVKRAACEQDSLLICELRNREMWISQSKSAELRLQWYRGVPNEGG